MVFRSLCPRITAKSDVMMVLPQNCFISKLFTNHIIRMLEGWEGCCLHPDFHRRNFIQYLLQTARDNPDQKVQKEIFSIALSVDFGQESFPILHELTKNW